MATSSIIDESYLPRITQALADLDLADREMELAIRAGLDKLPGGARFAAIAQQIAADRAALTQIKQVYFPNG